MTESKTVVVIGAGPAGLAAAAILAAARVIARPEATAWHAETGRIWIEAASGIASVPFTHLLCADEPLLLHALGCTFLGVVRWWMRAALHRLTASSPRAASSVRPWRSKRPGKLASPPRRSPHCPRADASKSNRVSSRIGRAA